MNELYFLKKQLDDLYGRIPKYEKDHGIQTKEEVEYNALLEKFTSLGRKVLNNDSLGYEDIKEVITANIVQKVKDFLKKDNQGMFDSIGQLDEMGRDGMHFLENCLLQLQSDEWMFKTDELFSEEKEFLNKFTDDDIVKFKNFSDYLRDIYFKESSKVTK